MDDGEVLKRLRNNCPSPTKHTGRAPVETPVEIQAALQEFAKRRISSVELAANGIQIVDLLWFEIMRSTELHDLFGLGHNQQQKLRDSMHQINRHAVKTTQPVHSRLG